MRPRKSGCAILPPKDGRKLTKEHDYWLFCLFRTNSYSVHSVNSAIGSGRIDGILFRSFQNQNRSQKNTITTNPVYSHSGIVPKEGAQNSELRKTPSPYILTYPTVTKMSDQMEPFDCLVGVSDIVNGSSYFDVFPQFNLAREQRYIKPIPQSCAVVKSETFWRATGQSNLVYKRLAATKVWFSYSHNFANEAVFHSVCQV